MPKVCPLMSNWVSYSRINYQDCIGDDCALWSMTLNGCSLNNGVVNLVKPNPIETYKV